MRAESYSVHWCVLSGEIADQGGCNGIVVADCSVPPMVGMRAHPVALRSKTSTRSVPTSTEQYCFLPRSRSNGSRQHRFCAKPDAVFEFGLAAGTSESRKTSCSSTETSACLATLADMSTSTAASCSSAPTSFGRGNAPLQSLVSGSLKCDGRLSHRVGTAGEMSRVTKLNRLVPTSPRYIQGWADCHLCITEHFRAQVPVASTSHSYRSCVASGRVCVEMIRRIEGLSESFRNLQMHPWPERRKDLAVVRAN